MLLQGQDDAVGDDGGEDHVLERSERLKSRSFCVRLNFQTSNKLIINIPKQVCRVITVLNSCVAAAPDHRRCVNAESFSLNMKDGFRKFFLISITIPLPPPQTDTKASVLACLQSTCRGAHVYPCFNLVELPRKTTRPT